MEDGASIRKKRIAELLELSNSNIDAAEIIDAELFACDLADEMYFESDSRNLSGETVFSEMVRPQKNQRRAS